jgi:inorganic pyrophosphatase
MSRHDPTTLPATADHAHQWHVIIETPQGSRNKYKYDAALGVFRVAALLPEGLSFPYDFGFLPSTLGEDKDPLDVLLLMDVPTFCGCLVPCRFLGVLEARQTEKGESSERNDRIIAAAVETCRYEAVVGVRDLGPKMLDQIEVFFKTYNQERDKKFEVLAWRGPKHAEKLVRAGMKLFDKKHPK